VPSDIVVAAWLEHFSYFPHVTRDDLLDAVRVFYIEHRDQQVQAADLAKIARANARERYERSSMDSAARRDHEALCDSKAGADQPALENRRMDILRYARQFGISPAEAEVRMSPGQGARNELDARRVEVLHRRQGGPPGPVPCPQCGASARCEHDEIERPGEEDIHVG
jgi:hypothetical protein